MSADIAAERIERLAGLAEEAVLDGHSDRSREYVRLARRLAERHRLSLPKRFARAACDRCDVYQRPGRNVRVRTGRGRVIRRCDCGATARHPYRD
ncbi:ribonuclease P protein component 4 [Halolamina sp.]|jgi:RNase P subunit RPR2|uniref:ribonuclease P protein component 4 n=1 Tax=Halolamina sp. TaxID=1940283 RepID=UPI000223B8BB|nr:Ribonuclease P protein component 4 [halophilic archaeon DL31]